MTPDAVQRVLNMVGVRNIRPSSEGFSCSCPYHRDRHASFAISVRKGVFVCYSEKCGASGPTWTLLRDFLGYSRAQAENYLPTIEVADPKDLEPKAVEPPFNPAILGVYKRQCPVYLLGRGFTKATLKEWEVGYDALTQTAVIPVRSADGKLVGLVKRDTTGESQSKYVHLYYHKGDYLFGEHRVDRAGHVYVTEGTLSPIKAFQAGLLNVVSTGGSRVTPTQIEKIAAFESVTLVMDGDRDGQRATERIVEKLLPRLGSGMVWVCDSFSPGLKDLDEEIDSGNLHRLLQSSQLAEDWLFSTSRMGQYTER